MNKMNGQRNRSEGVIEEKCSNARCGTSNDENGSNTDGYY
jgi:hypothetical protein